MFIYSFISLFLSALLVTFPAKPTLYKAGHSFLKAHSAAATVSGEDDWCWSRRRWYAVDAGVMGPSTHIVAEKETVVAVVQ